MIEHQLTERIKALGGIAPKLVSPGFSGMPDRLILLPSRRLAFVEVKAPGETMRPLQVKRKKQLEALGFSVYCIDHHEQIKQVLDEIGGDAE